MEFILFLIFLVVIAFLLLKLAFVGASVLAKLKSLGYNVKHEVGGDQRDNNEWNYLIISWG